MRSVVVGVQVPATEAARPPVGVVHPISERPGRRRSPLGRYQVPVRFAEVGFNKHRGVVIEVSVYLFWGLLWVDVFETSATVFLWGRRWSWRLKKRPEKEIPRVSASGEKVGGWEVHA